MKMILYSSYDFPYHLFQDHENFIHPFQKGDTVRIDVPKEFYPFYGRTRLDKWNGRIGNVCRRPTQWVTRHDGRDSNWAKSKSKAPRYRCVFVSITNDQGKPYSIAILPEHLEEVGE